MWLPRLPIVPYTTLFRSWADSAVIYRTEDRTLSWRCDAEEGLDRRLGSLRAAMLHPVEVRGRRVDVALVFGYAQGGAHEPEQIVANSALAAGRARAAGGTWHRDQVDGGEGISRAVALLSEVGDADAAE